MKRFAAPLIIALGVQTLCTGQNLSYYTEVRGMVDGTLVENRYYDDPNLQETLVQEPTGNALARGQIAPGINRVSAHFDSVDPEIPAYMLMADAWTHWTDEVTVSDPDLNGTIGYFTASLRVSGSESFNLSGGYASGDDFAWASVYGFWDSWIGTSTDGGGSFLVGGWFGSWYSNSDGTIDYFGDDLTQPLTEVTLEFIYGQPFLLRTNMEAYVDAQNEQLLAGAVDVTLDFSHTAYWNGIGAFFDASGNVVSPSGFASRSGFDWRNSVVPEPATFVVLGLGLLAWRRRR